MPSNKISYKKPVIQILYADDEETKAQKCEVVCSSRQLGVLVAAGFLLLMSMSLLFHQDPLLVSEFMKVLLELQYLNYTWK